MTRIPTHEMKRVLPKGAKVVESINGIDLYNMNTFQNIMAWNQHNLDVPAFDYFGTQITYGDLPAAVDEYAKGFAELGITKDSVVTLSLPVTIECFLSLFAILNMGAISNNVNFLFLRNDLHRYTLTQKSDVLITANIYLPLVIDQIKGSGLKKVILIDLKDYLPEDKKDTFDDLNKFPKKVREALQDEEKIKHCLEEMQSLSDETEFVNMSDVLALGKKRTDPVEYPAVDIRRDSIYSYTSGTTGLPKCIVFTEESPNAIIEMHKGLDLRDFVGDRSLLVIPPTHATGMFYGAYLQLSKGKTLILQPIYDKKTFATDLRDTKANHTLAAASFYLEAVAQDNLKPGDLSALARPCSGGEPITKSNVYIINKWLKKCGSPEKVAIGGGSGEIGSSALTSYELDPITKTNETGYPIPGVYVKIVDPKTGELVRKGERGIIHISSAAASNRYLENPQATDEYFYYDENNIRWANLGDIAVQNENDSYSVLGRSTDSYIDENGRLKFLFDIEYALSLEDPVIEWEISAFKTASGKYDVLGQVVLKHELKGKEAEAIKYLCEKYKLDGIKLYDRFLTSEVTGKRDYQLLKEDRDGYYSPYSTTRMVRKTYLDSGEIRSVIIKNWDIETFHQEEK